MFHNKVKQFLRKEVFMKKIFLVCLLLTSALVRAQTEEVVLSDRNVTLTVEISAKNVKLSRADYSVPVVKVLVPELAGETILDHRNTNEGAPCLATYDTKKPEDVIQGKETHIWNTFRIQLVKRVELYEETEKKQVCQVTLIERVDSKIRGFNFTHERVKDIGQRNPQDCF
jgi:hypothetical protein